MTDDLLARMQDLAVDLANLHREMYDLKRRALADLTRSPHVVPVGDLLPRRPRRRGPRVDHHETVRL